MHPDPATKKRPLFRRVSAWALGLAVGIVMMGAGAAFAYWAVTVASGSNFAEANAQTLPTGATPSASVTPAANQTVTVSFAQATSSGGTALTAYNVKRYLVGSGSGASISGGCAIAASVVTCTDVPGAGSWQYADSPGIGTNWVGAESTKSTSSVVQSTTATIVSAASSVVVSTAIAPSATLSGATTSPAAGGSITFSVFGPQVSAPGTCTGAGWSSVGSAVTVTANGTYNATAAYTPTTAGTYWWYAAYGGDTFNTASNSGCGVTSTAVHLAVSPSTLPAATVYATYSQTISASGGTSPYTFAVSAGALPTGLSVSGSGVLSGTISASGQVGTFGFTVTATDHAGLTGSVTYLLTVNSPPISLSPTTLPNPVGEATYSQTVTGSGGQSPYTFAVTSGSLPTGLSLASSTGIISGTEVAPGTFSFTITGTDAHGYTGTRAYADTVVSPTFTISPSSLPTVTVYSAYSQTLSTAGGATPYSYTETGSLPTGLSFSSAGVLSGTVSASGQVGSYPISVTSTDLDAFSGSTTYTLTVGPPAITLSSLPTPTGDASYTQSVTASGGQGPYTYAKTAGTLPTGLSFSSSGAFSGTETAAGTFNFTITATDAHSYTGFQAYSLTVTNPTIAVAPTTLPNGIAGISTYTQTITSSGGASPYTYAVTVGSLPSWLSLSSGGLLSTTTSAAGTFSFTVSATDTNGFIGSAAYSFTVVPALTASRIGHSGTAACGISLGSCNVSTTASFLTGSAPTTELIVAYFTSTSLLSSGVTASVSGPFTNVTPVTTNLFSSTGLGTGELFAWTAKGNATTSSATVTFSGLGLTLSATAVLDVMQLTGNNTTTPVNQSIGTGSGNSTTASANFGSAPSFGDGSIVFVGALASTTFTTPSGATAIDVPATTGLFGLYLFDPATQNQNFTITSAHWGTIGVEFNHG